MFDKMQLNYKKKKLKTLMEEYINHAHTFDCGLTLAKQIDGQFYKWEQKMDELIKDINQLDNKNFKLFSEGYEISGLIR